MLACNATAATHWTKKGWKLNQNPAATVYRVLWSACEPVLFVYTGTFFVVSTMYGLQLFKHGRLKRPVYTALQFPNCAEVITKKCIIL